MSSTNRLCACGQTIPFTMVIAGKRRNLKNRKFCLDCSPFGRHNTRDLTQPRSVPNERYRVWQEKARLERKRVLVDLCGGRCLHCGYNQCVAALEFHHCDPADKVFALSKGNLLRPWPVLLIEVEKCDLLCANCHRELEENLRASR